ncbi:polysaccharide biosynthesis tyrosine autokinase [Thiohalomonas denitrificans]|uniref:Tyrosine-protein kinase Etk/Wzc n=1 Tax=Thiohalomonas denitrificans TaxID=415747 RepID=A0A1G5QIR3_9GAMM|nr:polysaccharide biosynthesis tyrosine autokinase [Thiohalomonas denitrificans]SCZ61572.1 tyrosine-protein kinase Etk/Wzc [Thiohalomonas denitrificans]
MSDFKQSPPFNASENVVDLREYVVELWRAKHVVFGIALLVLTVVGLYTFTARPIYQSDVLIQIDPAQADSESTRELSSISAGDSPVEAEMQLFRSRSVVGAAVDELNLAIVAEPTYLPVAGRAIAKMSLPVQELSAAWEYLKPYAWGKEKITVDRLEVPDYLTGQAMSLVAMGNDSYEIHDDLGNKLAEGRVGELLSQDLGDEDSLEILVSELRAHRGAQFSVTRSYRWHAVNKLRNALHVSQQGEETGIIRLALEGPDPELLQRILTTITSAYLQHNVARRAQEAEKTLEVLNKHLPALRKNLTEAENRLNDYRSSVGSVNVTLEAEALLERATSLETQLSELKIRRDDIENKFTPEHPLFSEINQQIRSLENERASLNAEMRKLPDEQEKSIRLERDVTVANELYLLLLNRAQEMRVMRAGTVTNARVIDPADLPIEPTKPKPSLMLSLGAILGTTLGIFGVVLRNGFRQGIDDPEVVEKNLSLPVYASILHSTSQAKLEKSRKFKGRERLLAILDRDSPTVEALRSLRTNVYFAAQHVEHPIVAITGPAPNIGKSFVASNLAVVLADSGKRTLLIDADMRKGHLHDAFAIQRGYGLSGVLRGQVLPGDAIHQTRQQGLDFLPCGDMPRNPSELLLHERFAALLERLRQHYDMIIVDSPPTLAVTDAVVIARHSDVNLMVLRAGQHPMGEIRAAMRGFQQSDLSIDGFIVNDVSATNSYYVRYYHQYAS